MISDEEVIGHEDEAAQENIVDRKDEKDVPDIFLNMDELRKGDLSGGERHDQDEGRQEKSLQRKSVSPGDKTEKNGNNKNEITILQISRHSFNSLTPPIDQFQG